MANNLAIRDFSPGLHTELDPSLLPDGACEVCNNVVFDRQTLRTRPGRVQTDYIAAAGHGARSLVEYMELVDDTADQLGAARFVAALGDALYATTRADQTVFAAIENGDVNGLNPVRMRQFKSKLYIVDGEHALRSWTPEEGISSIVDYVGPTEAPQMAAVVDDQAWLGNWIDGSITGYARTGAGATNGPWPFTHLQPLTVSGTCVGVAVRKMVQSANCDTAKSQALLVEQVNATVPGVSNVSLIFTAVDCRNVVNFTLRMKGVYTAATAPTVDVYFYANGVQYEMATAVATTTSYADTTIAWPAAITGATNAETIKSAVSAILIHCNFTGATQTTRLEQSAGIWQATETSAVGILFDGIYTDTGVSLFPEGTYEFTYSYDYGDGSSQLLESPPYKDTDPDHTSLYPSLEIRANSIQSLSIAVVKDNDVAPEAINIYARGGTVPDFRRIGRIATVANISTASRTAAVTTITTLESFRNLYPGRLIAAGEVKVSGVTPAGATSFDGEFEITANATATTFTYDQPSVADDTGTGGKAYPYDRLAPDVLVWNGQYDPGAEFLGNYIEATPAGCEIMAEYKGRMVYAQADQLYISNWDDAERVPVTALPESPTTYGGRLRVGTDGRAITGLAELGDWFLVFKQNSVWSLGPDPETRFSCLKLTDGVGCDNHESIAHIEGRALIWWQGDHIWSWDGQTFGEVGAEDGGASPVLTYLQAIDAKQRQGVFATYDRKNKWYQLTTPVWDSAEGEIEPTVSPSSAVAWGNPNVAIAQDGTLCAIYAVSNAVYAEYSYDYGETWITKTKLSGSQTAQSLGVVADVNNVFHVIYREVQAAAPTVGVIWYTNDSTARGTWATSVNLSDDAPSDYWRGAIATDSAANVHVVYAHTTLLTVPVANLSYKKRTVTTWGAAEQVNDSAVTLLMNSLVLTVDSGDTPQVIWGQYSGASPQAYGSWPDPDWDTFPACTLQWKARTGITGSLWNGTPTEIASGTVGVVCGNVIADGADLHFVAFRSTAGGLQEAGYMKYTADPAGWSAWETISGDYGSSSYDCFEPWIVRDHDGNLFVYFTAKSLYDTTYYQIYRVEYDAAEGAWQGLEQVTTAAAHHYAAKAVYHYFDPLRFAGPSWVLGVAYWNSDSDLCFSASQIPVFESLVYQRKAGSWTRWTNQPGGCAIYSQYAAVPGVYSLAVWTGQTETIYNRLMRLNEGVWDYSAHAAIGVAWSWRSQAFEQPGLDRYKDVTRVTVTGALENPPTTFTASLYANDASTADKTSALTLAAVPGGSGHAIWRPSAMSDCAFFQVELSGTEAQAQATREVTSIALRVTDRGAV